MVTVTGQLLRLSSAMSGDVLGIYSSLSLLLSIISSVQMKSWAGKALETVNCYAFLKRRLIGAC
jgi:hypothetical protein